MKDFSLDEEVLIVERQGVVAIGISARGKATIEEKFILQSTSSRKLDLEINRDAVAEMYKAFCLECSALKPQPPKPFAQPVPQPTSGPE